MCAPGCSNAWIADKYCDQVRNVNEDGAVHLVHYKVTLDIDCFNE